MLKVSLVSMAFLLVSQVVWAEKSYQDYWAETNVKFRQLLTGADINDKACNENQKTYLACFHSLNHAYQLIKNDGKIYLLKSQKAELDANILSANFDVVDPKAEGAQALLQKYWADVLEGFGQLNGVDKVYQLVGILLERKEAFSLYAGAVTNTFLRYKYDPHTYVTPTAYMERNSGGVIVRKQLGIVYATKLVNEKEQLVVTSVVEGSPAQLAGIEAGDVIEKANDKELPAEQTKEFSANDVVHFEVDGSNGRRSLTVEKKELNIANVRSKLLQRLDSFYGYIVFDDFMDQHLCESVEKKMKEFLDQKVSGFVLDIRNNGGGLVNQAICIQRLFTEQGSLNFVVKDVSTGKVELVKQDKESKISKDLPTVILVDGGSASASEILSTYLQAYRKAWIVGESTFGKGTMQNISELRTFSQISLGQTVAKYYGPHGVSPQIQGVTPDFEVLPSIEQKEATPFNRERDLYKDAIENKQREVPVADDRKEEIKNIKSCYETQELIQKDYDSNDEFKKRVFDQQLSAAESVIDCAIELKVASFTSTSILTYRTLD